MPSSSSSSDESDGASSSSGSGSGEKEETKKRKADGTVNVGSDSDSDSGSSEEEKKKKKKKEKKEKKKKKKKDKKAKKKFKKGKKDKKKGVGKKGKAGKKPKKANSNRDAVSNQFGKYGIIKQEDFFNKKPEFLCWAAEVKKEDTDSMGQMKQREVFKEFIEDYNTATMPTKKYYNLSAWDSLQTKKRTKKIRGDDMTEAQRAALASFDDEKARKEEIKHLQAKKQEEQISNEVNKMRMDKGKVEEMKHQDKLKSQMDMLLKAGNTDQAEKIKQRIFGRDDPRGPRGYEPKSS